MDDIKPIPRVLKNLLNKLEMKCDFEPKGCRVVVKLEDLASHRNSCLYDPKLECNRKYESEKTRTYSLLNWIRKSFVDTQQKQIQLITEPLSCRKIHRWFSPNGLILIHNTLECDKTDFVGLQYELSSAQCRSTLNENSPYFEIKIIDLGNRELYFGTSHCFLSPVNSVPKRIIYDGTNGEAYIRIVSEYKRLQESNAPKWQTGDTIGCGIKFMNHEENLDRDTVIVYFTRNKETVWEREVNIDEFGLYPTYWTNSYGSKIVFNSI